MNNLAVEANPAASNNEQAEAPEFDAQSEIARLRQERVQRFEGETQSEEPVLEEAEAAEETETEEPVIPEATEESTDTEEAEESESTEGDVLSQIDFEALDDETKRAIAEEIGSGAGKEIGKLRGEKKALAKELEEAKAQLAEAVNLAAPKQDTPFASINTVEELETRSQQIEDNVKAWERKLYTDLETELIGDKEVKGIRDAQGTFFTAEQILDHLDGEREKLKQVPQRKAAIESASQFLSTESERVESLKSELFADSEDLSEAFVGMVSDPKFGVIKQMFPDYAETLLETFAYSQLGKTKKVKKKKIVLPKKGAKPSGFSADAGTAQPEKQRGQSGRYRELGNQLSGNALDARQRLAAARERRQIRNSQ